MIVKSMTSVQTVRILILFCAPCVWRSLQRRCLFGSFAVTDYPKEESSIGLTSNDWAAGSFSDKNIRLAFIRKVYLILTTQLLVTVVFIAFFLFQWVVKWNTFKRFPCEKRYKKWTFGCMFVVKDEVQIEARPLSKISPLPPPLEKALHFCKNIWWCPHISQANIASIYCLEFI